MSSVIELLRFRRHSVHVILTAAYRVGQLLLGYPPGLWSRCFWLAGALHHDGGFDLRSAEQFDTHPV